MCKPYGYDRPFSHPFSFPFLITPSQLTPFHLPFPKKGQGRANVPSNLFPPNRFNPQQYELQYHTHTQPILIPYHSLLPHIPSLPAPPASNIPPALPPTVIT